MKNKNISYHLEGKLVQRGHMKCKVLDGYQTQTLDGNISKPSKAKSSTVFLDFSTAKQEKEM